MITLRAFRAIDNTVSSQRSFDGHHSVLKQYGVSNLTSASADWMENPNVYALTAEIDDDRSQDCESGSDARLLGGIRIHKWSPHYPLPVEVALRELEPRFDAVLHSHQDSGAGEVAGMWIGDGLSQRGVAPILLRAAISITNQLSVPTLFGFCPEHTYPILRSMGFGVIHSLGSNGEFAYPTSKYVSRLIQMDTNTLESTNPFNRQLIVSLRARPMQECIEIGPSGEFLVAYNLDLGL